MAYFDDLPAAVMDVIRSSSVSEFATVSKAGLAIDTPTLVFVSDDLATLDVATGLAYPVKAERARRNPKVGLTFDTIPDAPVVVVAGMARVADADLQANLERYLSETILSPPVSTQFTDWSITREAVFYLTRILIRVSPAHIRWWDNAEAMDGPPHEWRAPAGTQFPQSDPAPSGPGSPPSSWPQPSWQELAKRALSGKGGPGGLGGPGHLTMLDADGFPVSIRARSIIGTEEGFRLDVPAGAPWSTGWGTLSFGGVEEFVGTAQADGNALRFIVERALPILPTAQEPMQVLQPSPDTRAQLMKRLEHETRRRGQPIPAVPEHPPEPSAGAIYRTEAVMALMEKMNEVKEAASPGD